MNLILRLRGESIDGRHVCCLGSQLARIVTSLMGQLADVSWYIADVEVIGTSRLAQGQTPQFVGQSHQFVALVQDVDQFLRGVFLAVRGGRLQPHFRERIDTEDPVNVDLGDALVEIRAFDTTYFELLTMDSAIAAVGAAGFGVNILSE